VIFGKAQLVERMVSKTKEIFSMVRGGGKGLKWQGKVAEWQKGQIEALEVALQSI